MPVLMRFLFEAGALGFVLLGIYLTSGGAGGTERTAVVCAVLATACFIFPAANKGIEEHKREKLRKLKQKEERLRRAIEQRKEKEKKRHAQQRRARLEEYMKKSQAATVRGAGMGGDNH